MNTDDKDVILFGGIGLVNLMLMIASFPHQSVWLMVLVLFSSLICALVIWLHAINKGGIYD